MDIEIIDEILSKATDEYDRAITCIRQCIAAYEQKCCECIEQIALVGSLAEADVVFDKLYKIQGTLSCLLFNKNIEVGSKLEILVHAFERLHDPYIRDYWFKRFQAGQRWPD